MGMTEAQQQALDQIVHLMREHFEAGVVILVADNESDDLIQSSEIIWHGGYGTAVGWCEIAKQRLLTKQSKPSESPPSEAL